MNAPDRAWAEVDAQVLLDMHCVDITDAGDVSMDDEVILWGKGGMTLEETAQLTGMANCEIPCTVGRRVLRTLPPAEIEF